MYKRFLRAGAGLLTMLAAVSAAAQSGPCVTDDAEREVCLEAPAERIVVLAPSAAELTWSAGAGDRVVGVVEYSDYPEAAQDVDSVGNHTRVDMEKLLSLEPDLIVAWLTGNPQEQTDRLQELGLTLYFSEPHAFDTIASNIERLAVLAGTEETGHAVAQDFRAGIAELQAEYAGADPVSVFYQVWDQPLMTINGEHFINQAIALCGGQNIFADLPRLAPQIDVESVLERDPEAIVVGGMGEDDRGWLEPWQQYSNLQAVRADNLFFVPPSTIQRPTRRILTGAQTLCGKLETARGRR